MNEREQFEQRGGGQVRRRGECDICGASGVSVQLVNRHAGYPEDYDERRCEPCSALGLSAHREFQTHEQREHWAVLTGMSRLAHWIVAQLRA